MPIQLLINMLVAVLWMFLQDEFSTLTFTAGYLVGLALVYLMRGFMPSDFYPKKIIAVIKLLYFFSIVSSFLRVFSSSVKS